MSVDILPSSKLKEVKAVKYHIGLNWVPIFCANCGCDGGHVPEENCNFAFYLCSPCATKLGPITNTYMEPDVVFWQKVKEAQIEKYGRELTADEIAMELQDETSMLSKLATGRPKG